MWYDETREIPSEIVLKALHELGPVYERRQIPMSDRAAVLWNDTSFQVGYLFASTQALRNMPSPLMIPVRGRDVPYKAIPAGHIGESGGYTPPGYRWTPLPNRLMAFQLVAMAPIPEPIPAGEMKVEPLLRVTL